MDSLKGNVSTTLTKVKCLKCQQVETEVAMVMIFGKSFPTGGYCDECLAKFDEIESRQKERERIDRIKQVYRQTELPIRYVSEVKSMIKHDGIEKALKVLGNYNPSMKNNYIVLYGLNGTGKTLLLGYIARELSKKLIRSRFINESHVTAEFRANFDSDVKLRRIIGTNKVILLDDIGRANYNSEYYMNVLYRLWDLLWNNDRGLIATTNYTPEELQNRMDGRCFDRLMRGNPRFIEVTRKVR